MLEHVKILPEECQDTLSKSLSKFRVVFPSSLVFIPHPLSARHPIMPSGGAIPGELTDSLDVVVVRKENDKIVKRRNYFNL